MQSGAVERAAAGRVERALEPDVQRRAQERVTRLEGGHADDVLGARVLLDVQPDDLGAVVLEQPDGGGVFAAAVEFLKHGFGDGRACHGTHARAQPAPRSAVLHIRRAPFNGRVRPLVDSGPGRRQQGAS